MTEQQIIMNAPEPEGFWTVMRALIDHIIAGTPGWMVFIGVLLVVLPIAWRYRPAFLRGERS